MVNFFVVPYIYILRYKVLITIIIQFEKERRPHVVTDEHNLKRAERWRNQVIREVAKKVTQIQNGMEFSLIF